MRIEKQSNSLSKRFVAFVLCALMVFGLIPGDFILTASANNPAQYKIDVAAIPDTVDMKTVAYGAYNSGKYIGSANARDIFVQANRDPVTGGYGYRAEAFCVDHMAGLKDGDTYTRNDDNELAAVIGLAEPFLNMYYVGSHTNNAFGSDWTNGKDIAMRCLAQAAVWLAEKDEFKSLSEEEQNNLLAEHMFNAIKYFRDTLHYEITNGGAEYTDADYCLTSILFAKENFSSLPSAKYPYEFTYQVKVSNEHESYQRLLMPMVAVRTSEKEVYIKFQKIAEDTMLPLPNCEFEISVDGTKIDTYTTTSDEWQVYGPISIFNDSANISIKETKPASGYKGNANGNVIATAADNSTAATAAVIAGSPFKNTIERFDPPSSSSLLLKIDKDTGRPLAGATFRLTGSTGTYDRTTGNDGGETVAIQWHDPSNNQTYVPAGHYTVTEIHPPDGYGGTTESQDINLYATWSWDGPDHGDGSTHDLQEYTTCYQPAVGETASNSNGCGKYTFNSDGPVTFQNAEEHGITLHKVDESGKGLAGAEFDIFFNNQYIDTKTTGPSGTFTVPNLKTGYYMFKETKAPAGYILPNDPVEYIYIDIDAQLNQRDHHIYMTNYDIPDIRIAKIDSVSGYPVPGAIFEVSIGSKPLTGTYKTGVDGTVTIPRADYDHLLITPQTEWTISVTEVTAPPDYFLSAQTGNGRTQTKTMTRGTDMATFTFENAPYFPLEIAKFIDGTNTYLDGAKFDVYINGNLFKQGISGDSGTGMFNIDKTELGTHLAKIGGTSWTFMVKETSAPDGYLVSNPNEYTQTIHMGRSEPVYFAFGNPPTSTFEIYKTNDSGEPLEGATFEIYIDNTLAFTKTTEANGYINITPEEFGKYLGNGEGKTSWIITVTEIAAPSGYLLPAVEYRSQSQTVQKGQQKVSFSFVNTIYPDIRLIKEDGDTCEPLDNALFQLDIAGKTFGTFITDKNGEIVIKYEDSTNEKGELVKGYGRFLDDLDEPNANQWQVKFTEITPPGGYLLPDNPVQENTLVLGQTLSVFSFYNWKYPDIVIQKYDSSNNQLLAGATFDVFIDGTKIPGSFITDDTGTIRISYDVYGTYLDNINKPSDKTWTVRVVETSAPANYFNAGVLTNKSQENILVLGSKLTEFVFKNEPFPDVQVYKESTKTNNPLPGVTYALKGEDNLNYFTAVTDENGIAYFENVPEGVYTLLEIDVPSGYILSEKTYIVKSAPSQSGNKQVLKYSYGNDDNPTLTIIKVDSITGERLPNVKLTVSYSPDSAPDSTIHLGDFMTDENGEIIFTTDDNLEEGNYTVYEPSPPTGYQYHVTDGDTTTFHLDGNEEYVHTIRNTPKSALIIHKIDSDTGLAVAGATFEVRYANGTSGASGNIIGTYKTSINGTITINGLEAGTYIVEEVKAAPNYELSNPSVQTAVITGNEQDVVELWFSNAKKGTLAIYKLDAVTKQPLANAQFKVTDSSGSPIGNSNGIFVTDASGVIQIDEFIKIGETITVQEIAAPDGYVLDSTAQNIKIKENTSHSLTFYNQPKGSLIIIKRDTVTGEVLQGAEFTVTNSAGEFTAQSGGTISSNGIYTTDANGMIHLTNLPEDTYVVTETKAPDKYNLPSNPSQTVKVNANDTQTLTFWNSPQSAMQIIKIDADDKTPIKNVEFKISHKNGQVIGTYTTNADGIIILDGFEAGWYTAVETKAADGYVLDSNPRDFEITNNQFVKIVFENVKQPGLKILKVDSKTGAAIPNTTFEVRGMDQSLIGTYKTDSNGVIYITGLEAGYYTVTETIAADGYIPNDTPKTVQIKDGGTTLLTVENTKGSGIMIYKIDSVTKEGLPGAVFLLSDSKGTPIGRYTSDDKGRVWVDDVNLTDTKYFLEEIQAPEGYMIDKQQKTLYLANGKTTTITWENTAKLGQIQIQKLSSDYNDTNGLPKNSPLAGATFGIYSYRSGAQIGTMTSGSDGWAISNPLPLGQYVIKELQAPQYYSKSSEEIIITLEYENQIIKEKFYNDSANLEVSINKTGVIEATVGSNIMYTFKDIRNLSSTPLNDFYWRDTLPTEAVRINYLVTGTYSFNTKYDVYVTTSYGRQIQVAGNMSTQKDNYIDMSAAAVGLQTNEYITSFMLNFGQVPVGFRQETDPRIECYVLSNIPNGTQFVNKADVGGTSNGEWIIQNTTWKSKIYNPNTRYPQTGY